MSPALVVFVLLYAGLLAVWALASALLGRRPGLGLVGGLVLLELTVIAQAVLDVVALLGSRRAVEPATHTGYLATSVLLLPLLLALARPPRVPGSDAAAGAGRRWDSALIAVACVALVVVERRLVATGPVSSP